MTIEEGDFVWHELMTSDPGAAAAFYAAVVGWRMEDAGMPGFSYTLAKIGDRHAAGLMGIPEGMTDAKPFWFGYIAATDVDARAKEVVRAGGALHREPADIPGVGRFAVVADPQGAAFMLFRGEGEMPPAPPPGTAGEIGWHELHAKDWEDAFSFYESQFGWTKAEAVDMGAMGTYQLFAHGDHPIGGMMTSSAAPMPFWLHYFIVDAIDPAVDRIAKAGGTVLHGPMEVPGGSWVVQAQDPQGAMFALVSPPKSAG